MSPHDTVSPSKAVAADCSGQSTHLASMRPGLESQHCPLPGCGTRGKCPPSQSLSVLIHGMGLIITSHQGCLVNDVKAIRVVACEYSERLYT